MTEIKIDNIAKTLFIIVITIAIGVFAVNQTLRYVYNSEFLQAPCNLCLEINPALEPCFKESLTTRVPINNSDVSYEPIKFNFTQYS